jgi:thiamine-monophosphate kinase
VKLSQLGEFGLIDLIAKRESKHSDTVVGIGDDCAVLKIPSTRYQVTNKLQKAKYLLITTDTLVENVHFKLPRDSFFDIGQKAMIANISDIAAMGGIPTHALVTIGLPEKITVEKIKELYRGIDSLAKRHKIDIVGGDTISSPGALVVSITMLGEVEKKYLLLRSGAKVGDLICVTGEFGGPAAEGFESRESKVESRIREARMIAKKQIATSMIDSSDGLVRSVIEICRASKVGAKIWEDRVPVARGAVLDQALYGGEEYELVFTMRKSKVESRKSKVGNAKMHIIGEIVMAKCGVKLMDARGKLKALKSGGYEHFR